MVLTLDGSTGVPYYAIDLLYIFHIDMQLKYFKYLKYQIVFQTTGYSIQHWYECCIKYQQFRVNNSFLWIICSLACHLSISLTNESSFEVMVEQTILVTTLKIFEIKKMHIHKGLYEIEYNILFHLKYLFSLGKYSEFSSVLM